MTISHRGTHTNIVIIAIKIKIKTKKKLVCIVHYKVPARLPSMRYNLDQEKDKDLPIAPTHEGSYHQRQSHVTGCRPSCVVEQEIHHRRSEAKLASCGAGGGVDPQRRTRNGSARLWDVAPGGGCICVGARDSTVRRRRRPPPREHNVSPTRDAPPSKRSDRSLPP